MKTCLISLVAVALAPLAHAGIEGTRLGTSPPPPSIGGIDVTGFPYDDRLLTDVLSVPDGFGREISFNHAVNCRRIGLGWATWSHGYAGNVYYANSDNEITIYFPRGTKAAYLYAETGPFGIFPFIVTAFDGVSTVSLDDDVEGMAGAKGWGFWATGASDVVYVHVWSSQRISVGEFGISAPCPADLDVDGFIEFTDFLLFLTYYDAGDERVDYTDDGLVDFADYLLFLNYYGSSCDET